MQLCSALLIVALFTACSAPGVFQPSRVANPDRAAWVEATARWEAARPERYAYTLTLSCECAGPVVFSVVVDGTTIESITVPPEHQAQLSAKEITRGADERGLTVEELFGMIDRAINAGNQIGVTYDATFGFPTQTQPNVLAAAVDASTGYFISDFTPLL